MEARKKEVKTKNSEIKELDISLTQVPRSICKISYENECGTGFLIRLFKDGKELYCLMSNEHVIKEAMIDSKETINVDYKFETKLIQVKLDSNERFIKYDPTLDFTVVEVGDLIKQKYFLLPNIHNIDYINQKIYIPQYPEGNKLSVSEGKILKINIEDNELVYDASTGDGSSGSPILLKNTTEVIGIHKEGNTHTRKENYGTLINSIIEFIQSKNNKSKKSNENISIIKDNQKNEILCIYNKQEDEINLLYDYSEDTNDWSEEGKKSYIEGKNNINEKNIEIYINNKKIKFNYKYKSNERGEIKVKFIFNKLLTSTAYMFRFCYSLQSIDLSSFNTTNVKDMNMMFFLCSSLKKRNVKIGEYGKKILVEMWCLK